MGKEGESDLQIINGRLGFLIAVIFVVTIQRNEKQ